MRNIDPPPPPHKVCMQLDIVGGCLKMHFVRVATLLLSCHGNANCLLVAKNVIFNSVTVVKSAKCVALFLKSFKTLQPKTWSRCNTIVLVYICAYSSLLCQICVAYTVNHLHRVSAI